MKSVQRTIAKILSSFSLYNIQSLNKAKLPPIKKKRVLTVRIMLADDEETAEPRIALRKADANSKLNFFKHEIKSDFLRIFLHQMRPIFFCFSAPNETLFSLFHEKCNIISFLFFELETRNGDPLFTFNIFCP